jgi:hypothetical protein
MNERIRVGRVEQQYSPLGERGKKIISEWKSYKKQVGGLEGNIILDQVERGRTQDEINKEMESLRPIRKALIDEYNANRVK